MAEKRKVPASEGLFIWPSSVPGLMASRCVSCGTCYFPKTFTCQNPDCTKKNVEDIALKGRGKLWSYTIVHYQPPSPYISPGPFKPFYIGLVEFPEGIRILGQLTGTDNKDVTLDMDVELVIEKLYDDADGNEAVTWKFKVL